MSRLYHLILVNDKTGKRHQLTTTPEPHSRACKLKWANETNYYKAHKELRLLLEEVQL